MSTPAPARVFGFVAAEADVCVLLRRGPGKHTLMVRWDLATDEFEIGQWLFGWVSDAALSKDGQLLAYQAHKSDFRPERYFMQTTYYYNCVSRPPYFTALAFWDTGFHSKSLRWQEVFGTKPILPPQKGSVPEFFRRRLLFEDGERFWSGCDRPPVPNRHSSQVGELVLYREPQQRDFYSLNDEILEADWADVDHRGRVLFAREGRIYIRDAEGERELIDLSPLTFRPLAPPGWATRWPTASVG